MSQELFGYEILDQIGEGAGSVIYAVSHNQTKQIYALKHVLRKTDKHARFIEQLEAASKKLGRRTSRGKARAERDHAGASTSFGEQGREAAFRNITFFLPKKG
jgi:serine/threonine protein kinase